MIKNRILLISIIAMFIMGGIIMGLGVALDNATTDRDQAIDLVKHKDDTVSYYQNKLDRETARSSVIELSARNASRLRDTRELEWLRQFEGVNKRLNNVEQASKVTARVVGNFKIPLGDTTIFNFDNTMVKARKFDNKDKWLRNWGIVLPDTVVSHVTMDVPIESAIFWQRKHKFLGMRFGKKLWTSEAASPNPYAHITENKIIRIGKKK